MKRNGNKFISVASIVLVVLIIGGTITVASLSGVGMITREPSKNNQENDVKYEKPAVGDVAQDGAYPDEMKSDASPNAQGKEWYEYITYSKTPIGEVQEGKTKMVFYDPYDYNYGMIMEISHPESSFGSFYDPEGYTTANEMSVTSSVTQSHSWSSSLSADLGFELALEQKAETEVAAGLPGLAEGKITVGVTVAEKFSTNLGVSNTQSGSVDSSTSKTVTYNALYFNSNGTPYRWRIVKYTVYLPLYCEVQTLVNGKWTVTNTVYCVLATVQGTCREWIDNVAYIEDWRTGEPVQVENFWNEFFSRDALITAYEKQMIPQN